MVTETLTWKRGLLVKSSPRIQPQLQTSMEGPYLSSPSSSSGGRYHRVITLLVYGLSLSSALYSLQVQQSQSHDLPV